jgi:hypothetical protein
MENFIKSPPGLGLKMRSLLYYRHLTESRDEGAAYALYLKEWALFRRMKWVRDLHSL